MSGQLVGALEVTPSDSPEMVLKSFLTDAIFDITLCSMRVRNVIPKAMGLKQKGYVN